MIVTRFAPSPTGYLHIGGLRTALYSYLWAKKNNGEFKLRIEDTDKARNSDDAVRAILESFEWVGMPSDSKIEYQSKRENIYNEYLNKLLDSGNAYKCYMSKEDLAELRASQEERKETPRYDETWRPEDGKILPSIPEGVSPVIRIKAPKNDKIEFLDGVKGSMSFEANSVDDFIIARADGTPTYNFVVAVDDALMGITDVLRGDDHLSNTPKQIVIYNALNLKIPKFYHIPMINNPQGKKLSKRDGAMDVMEYKKLGYLPEALLNFLVRLGWSSGDKEIFTIDEMLELFNPNDINKSASAYNQEKLDWLNSEYIKNSSNDRLISLLKELEFDISEFEKKDDIVELCKTRVKTVVELKDSIDIILNPPKEYNKKGIKKFIKSDTIEIVETYLKLLEDNRKNLNSVDDYENITKPFLESKELKMPKLFQPLRISITGGTNAPSIYDMIYILGLDEVKERVLKAIEIFKRKFENE
jgi:glutamyl-tRNA synthetase